MLLTDTTVINPAQQIGKSPPKGCQNKERVENKGRENHRQGSSRQTPNPPVTQGKGENINKGTIMKRRRQLNNKKVCISKYLFNWNKLDEL